MKVILEVVKVVLVVGTRMIAEKVVHRDIYGSTETEVRRHLPRAKVRATLTLAAMSRPAKVGTSFLVLHMEALQ